MTEHYSDHALAILKEKGFRITQPRRQVVAFLADVKKPATAQEIRDTLHASGERIDAASVYRILECLEEQQLVHRLLGSGKVIRCRLDHEDHCHKQQPDHCHHLLVCERCGDIDEVHCVGLHPIARDIQKQTGFQTRRHLMELSGTCKRCG